MPSHRLVCVFAALALAGCASSMPAPEPVSPAPASAVDEPAEKKESRPAAGSGWSDKPTTAERQASSRQKAKAPGYDPLAVDPAAEAALIPKTVITPRARVRHKTPKQMVLAMEVLKSANSVDGAARMLTARLGDPSWTESWKGSPNSKRRVWVAFAEKQCQRLVLEPDGAVQLEVAWRREWRQLSSSATQNACTGEIRRAF